MAVRRYAVVYCEKEFGRIDGKTAAGLVRYSELYSIMGIIDSSLVGKDAGQELGESPNGIPIYSDLADALARTNKRPDTYIYGKAPLEAMLSPNERRLILEAINNGLNIVSGLHQFLSEDSQFRHAAYNNGITISDIRKPPRLEDMHIFTGKITEVNVPVVAVLGTDCASGKLTTANKLNQYLNKIGVKSTLVATGQTGLMQGARHGVSIDALVSQFVIGEIEHCVLEAFYKEQPDIILVEGQSSVSHPAFLGSISILRGCQPDGIILQHPPGRKYRCDFPDLKMPTIEEESSLIESISAAKILAITLNHENLTPNDVERIISEYENLFDIPTTDILAFGCYKIVQALIEHFPELKHRLVGSFAETVY